MLKEFIKVMKALSDPSRAKILKILQHKEMCVCEIQSLLELAQPTISKHLKTLEDAGLVEKRKDKLWVNYRPADGSESAYAKKLLTEINSWLDDDPEIIALIKKIPTVDRLILCRR